MKQRVLILYSNEYQSNIFPLAFRNYKLYLLCLLYAVRHTYTSPRQGPALFIAAIYCKETNLSRQCM